jgi:hypothetical protein
MARHGVRRKHRPSIIIPAGLFFLGLLTACGGLPGGQTLPAAPASGVVAPATTDTPLPAQADFYAQLKEYGVTLAAGGDAHKVARQAMNACPEYTRGQTETERVAHTAERFGMDLGKARLIYSATVLHLCGDVT